MKSFSLILILLFSMSAFARRDGAAPDCGFQLEKEETLRELQRDLRRPNAMARDAIRQIVDYLKSIPGDGPAKYTLWAELTHLFNKDRTNNQWINAPKMVTVDKDIVLKGETRGHLLVIRPDGTILKSFNPLRDTPITGFRVDATDPTWK